MGQYSKPHTKSKLAAKGSIRARVEEIQAENEAECRWGRKQLLDFYCDVLERSAGSLTPDDRLCQGVERVTVEHLNAKGQVTRTTTKERLIMPPKMEAADGIRKMLGWDKRPNEQPEDDITELLVMIRRKSGQANALTAQAETIQLPAERSSEHLPALPLLPSASEAEA